MTVIASKKHTVLVILFSLLLRLHLCESKTKRGEFTLSGVNTEALLTKFVFSGGSYGTINLNLVAFGAYPNNALSVYMYTDEEWPRVKRATTCSEKIKLFKMKRQINLQGSETNVDFRINNMQSKYPVVWYITIADCPLEEYYQDNLVPKVKYDIKIVDSPSRGSSTHIPVDEQGMFSLHTFNTIVSLLLAGFIVLKSLHNVKSKSEIHISLVFVFVACFTHGLSSLCEMIHLKLYDNDGIGSYTLDAFSAYFEAICDSIIALLLLAVAGGWTLPSDIKPQSESVSGVAGSVFDNLLSFSRRAGRSGSYRPAVVLFSCLLVVHLGLAQWGRTYSDDFDCYHDLEHVPGQILFLCRFLTGCLFLYSTAHLRRSTHCGAKLRSFYVTFSFIGGTWFIFLSTLAWWTSRLVPVYRRHEVVSGGAALGQAMALASLTWLFIAGVGASAFHKVSKVATGDMDGISGGGIGESKGGCWKVGKVKVNTD